MKVYIGPYQRWWSTHNWCEKVIARRHGKEWGFEVDEKDYDWVDRAVERFGDIWQSVLNVTINPIFRWWGRKIMIRIDPWDTWSMDHTLAMIILPMLKQLKTEKHGSPFVEDEDVPEELRSDPNRIKMKKGVDEDVHAVDSWEPDNKVHERWTWVLDQMIWTFEQLVDEDEGHWQYYDPYEEGEHVERLAIVSADGTKKYLTSEDRARERGKYNPEKHRQYNEKIANGLRLFGKYYRGLWD